MLVQVHVIGIKLEPTKGLTPLGTHANISFNWSVVWAFDFITKP